MLGPVALRLAPYAAVLAAGMATGWVVNGWRLEARINKIEAIYAKAFADAKQKSLDKQTQLQIQADKIRKEQNEKIQNLKRGLDIATNSLRNRPSIHDNAKGSGTGQAVKGCTGAELYRENANDLIWEATRAEVIREGLLSCYKQYDAIKDSLNNTKGK